MGKSSISNRRTENGTPIIEKAPLKKQYGIYTFIDEDGNIVEIKKEKDERKPYEKAVDVKETVLSDGIWVIGVQDTVAMGAGDLTACYAIYI